MNAVFFPCQRADPVELTQISVSFLIFQIEVA